MASRRHNSPEISRKIATGPREFSLSDARARSRSQKPCLSASGTTSEVRVAQRLEGHDENHVREASVGVQAATAAREEGAFRAIACADSRRPGRTVPSTPSFLRGGQDALIATRCKRGLLDVTDTWGRACATPCATDFRPGFVLYNPEPTGVRAPRVTSHSRAKRRLRSYCVSCWRRLKFHLRSMKSASVGAIFLYKCRRRRRLGAASRPLPPNHHFGAASYNGRLAERTRAAARRRDSCSHRRGSIARARGPVAR